MVVNRDTTNPPAQISNPSGAIYLKNATSGLILMDRLLASRFNISDGQHDIVVPDVPCGPYQIVCECLSSYTERLELTFAPL